MATQHDGLLIEIGIQPLPFSSLCTLAKNFASAVTQELAAQGIPTSTVQHFAAPNRFSVLLSHIPFEKPAREMLKKGPPFLTAFDSFGNPSAATLIFAKKYGVEVSHFVEEKKATQDALHVTIKEESASLASVLPLVIENALFRLPGKRIRWNKKNTWFLRPIDWICVKHGAIDYSLNILGMRSTNVTYGHRVYCSQAVIVPHANDYVALLRSKQVLVDYQERFELIKSQLKQLADSHIASPCITHQELTKITELVEWPVCSIGTFDADFLTLPEEVLLFCIQSQPLCVAIKNRASILLPIFVIVSNVSFLKTTHIINKNEQVMHARLAKARAFFASDTKIPLAARLEQLKKIILHRKLGSLYDKSIRISKSASQIGTLLGAPRLACEHAGKLAKTDLLTDMVGEFKKLKGTIGCYYALANGETKEAATAIYEHYHPRFANDSLPSSLAGISLALADRLDNLIGLFGVGLAPLAKLDPFALRRQALAIVRILIEKKISLNMHHLCLKTFHTYGNVLDEEVVSEVVIFCIQRFKRWISKHGMPLSILDATLTISCFDPFDCYLRAQALQRFLTKPENQPLLLMNKRIKSILQKNGFTDSTLQNTPVQPTLIKDVAECALFDKMQTLAIELPLLLQAKQYDEGLFLLLTLYPFLNHFFNDVRVLATEPALKLNRLHLLSHLHALFLQIADFSKVKI